MAWRGAAFDGEFPSLGWDVIDWIEHYLCHGPGDVVGEAIDLDDELVEFVVRAYRVDPSTGRRVYRRGFFSRPKGRAKSELAGMLACAELLGPTRFAGWTARGEPVGRPVRSPFIRCLATEESQAGNTYENIPVMLDHLSANFGDEFPGIDFGNSTQSSSRIFVEGGGEVRPSTASDASKDGGKETFVVADETHLMVLPAHKRMHATVRRNLRKRKDADPWMLETSTMYLMGGGSVAEETHGYAQAIAEGRVRERGLLFDHKQADDVDLGNRDELLEALRYVYGPFSEHMDLDGIIAEIYDPQSDPQDSRRYWLNCPSSASDAWISSLEWSACEESSKVVAKGDTITLGFDGSRGRSSGVADSTALVGCRVEDGHIFQIAVWEQPEGPAGVDWLVPVAEVEAAVRDTFARYTVVGFYADPSGWESQIAAWEAEYHKRLKVKAHAQSPIKWWMNQTIKVGRAVESFATAVRGGEMTHDGAYTLTRHVLNARRRVDRNNVRIDKEHKESSRKIDAAHAALLAWQARLDAVAANVSKPRRSRKLTRY